MTGAETLRPFLWRAERLYPDRELVARTADGVARYTYAEYADRARRLSSALDAAGVGRGDRVGTLCWNHRRHFEAYFAVPNLGAQLHTLNPLLPDAQVRDIVADAGDRVLLVDASLADELAAAYDPDAFESVERVVVVGGDGDAVPDGDHATADYASFVAGGNPDHEWPRLDGDVPAGLCYTSGTTGSPKGIEYTQRALWTHTMCALTPMAFDLDDASVVMPVVPMFHVNAWGLPYAATAAGAKQVFPGPAPDPADLAVLVADEGVTFAAGVPTVWLDLLEYAADHAVDLSTLDRVLVGGAAPPDHLIEGFADRGVEVLHAWGMTETAPIGTIGYRKVGLDDAAWATERRKQGLVAPGLEFRVVDDGGTAVPWDGETIGELLIRGPWVADAYLGDGEDDAFDGSWLRTGDLVTVDEAGYVEVVDRTDDAIRSGGEWISSQAVENALMAHDAVAEAAVVGAPHDRYGERPVGVVATADGVTDRDRLRGELVARVREDHPSWWAPDAFVFVDEVPKTATGKFAKGDLRERYGDPSLVAGEAPEGTPDRD